MEVFVLCFKQFYQLLVKDVEVKVSVGIGVLANTLTNQYLLSGVTPCLSLQELHLSNFPLCSVVLPHALQA